jgi:hypothetical protein
MGIIFKMTVHMVHANFVPKQSTLNRVPLFLTI